MSNLVRVIELQIETLNLLTEYGRTMERTGLPSKQTTLTIVGKLNRCRDQLLVLLQEERKQGVKV